MKINGVEIKATSFAYDGCHKIYLIESEAELREVLKTSYEVRSISELEETYLNSCGLEFISNWSLTKQYAEQCENAKFEY